jgi:hypothetical protein
VKKISYALLFLSCSTAFADEAVDLSSLGADAFTPYVLDRNKAWLALPVFAFLMVVWHLKRSRLKKQKVPANKPVS